MVGEFKHFFVVVCLRAILDFFFFLNCVFFEFLHDAFGPLSLIFKELFMSLGGLALCSMCCKYSFLVCELFLAFYKGVSCLKNFLFNFM